jgi:hypothetical protein
VANKKAEMNFELVTILLRLLFAKFLTNKIWSKNNK